MARRNRIRGITVEIGGDVTKLDKALQGTNKYLDTTTKNLKDVERLLKLDPKNVELMDQKQRLLSQAVEATSEKYETLDKILKTSTASNVKYAEWEKAFSSLQRQITKTANDVSKFEKAVKDLEDLGFAPDSSEVKEFVDRADAAREKLDELQASVKRTYDEMGRPISIDQFDTIQREFSEARVEAENAQKAFDDFSPAASRFSDAADTISDKAGKIASATKGVSLAAGGLLTGMLGSVKGTEEFRSGLSKLETNAQQAGVSMESIDGALKEFNRVSDDSDSNIEALSNLLQSGITDSTLQQAVEALAGTVEQFPQTLKLESLADGLQETLATGAATGQFAEALDRLGIGAEEFNAQLSEVPGTANKLHFALDTLTNQGLADVHRAWVEEHGDLIENKDATYEFQKSLAKLGEEMQPLMTMITELASSFLDWFNGLSDGQQGAIVALIAIVAALSPVAMAISSVSGALGEVADMTGKVEDGIADVIGFFLKNPMLAAVLAIAGAVALIALNWDKVKEAAKKTIDAIVGLVEKGINAVKRFFGVLDDSDSSGGKGRGGLPDAGTPSPRQNGAPLAAATALLDDLPHFAGGGVFAPNNPMLGVLGDNKTEYEVAAPESVIRDSVLDALFMSGLMNGQRISVDVHFTGTLAQVVREMHPLITAETVRLGPSLAPKR